MQLLSFSTDSFAARERADAARAAYAGFASIGIEPRGEGPFRSEMTALPLPGLGIGRIVNSACAVNRNEAHIAGGNDDLVLFIVTEGRVKARLKGREEAVYSAGEAYLAPNDLPGDFLLDNIAHIQIALPRALLERRLAEPDAIVGRRLRVDASPPLAFLAQHAGMAMAQDDWTPALASLAASHMEDLVALVLGAGRDDGELARQRGLRAARLRGVLAEIDRHFLDPRFAAVDAGAAVGIAERTVHDLLQETGSSFSERVLELRLQRAFALLSRRGETRQVSQIAYACGFNSVAHFNRCFRRRFGATPTAARSDR